MNMSNPTALMMIASVLLYSMLLIACSTIVNIDAKSYQNTLDKSSGASLNYISSNDKSSIANNDDMGTVDNNGLNLSAIGTIDSLIITVPQNGFNITNAFKVVLTGDWSLSIKEGNVTYFDASFLATPMDGTKPHIHQLTNFKADGQTNDAMNGVQLKRDGDYNHDGLTVNGTVDVKINGEAIWDDVDSSISIKEDKVMSIYLDDEQTDLHFGKQHVFGIVRDIVYN
jgi:hypothetical protein